MKLKNNIFVENCWSCSNCRLGDDLPPDMGIHKDCPLPDCEVIGINFKQNSFHHQDVLTMIHDELETIDKVIIVRKSSHGKE